MIYRSRFPDLRVIAAFKAFPSELRVTNGPNRPGENSSPLTVTRSCGIYTHFPFYFEVPRRKNVTELKIRESSDIWIVKDGEPARVVEISNASD
jgi:hypothetical protein